MTPASAPTLPPESWRPPPEVRRAPICLNRSVRKLFPEHQRCGDRSRTWLVIEVNFQVTVLKIQLAECIVVANRWWPNVIQDAALSDVNRLARCSVPGRSLKRESSSHSRRRIQALAHAPLRATMPVRRRSNNLRPETGAKSVFGAGAPSTHASRCAVAVYSCVSAASALSITVMS